MATLFSLINACQAETENLRSATAGRIALWDKWLQPISRENPSGDDPGYDDDFQQIREEVNKLSGADSDRICALAEKLLTCTAKDIRIATYYTWARLQRDGENGLADGLELLAGLLQRFTGQLHPRRDRSRCIALEWLCSSRMLDSLSRYPEVVKTDTLRITGALWWIEHSLAEDPANPVLDSLYQALESRLITSGGVDAIVPQNVAETPLSSGRQTVPALSAITSGQDLLAQARGLAKYLRDQPDGWLSAHHLMKSIRHDTLHQLPPLSSEGKTRIEPPKPDQRAQLKRLWLQQSWAELLEQSDAIFSRGANHLWLDLQWYTHQALLKSGQPVLATLILNDLQGLLIRLPGLETLSFNNGMPFADEVTLHWISQQVMENEDGWPGEPTMATSMASDDNDILALEPEVLQLTDSKGIDAAFDWLQNRPGVRTERHCWLLRLLMARVAEQTGKTELALHLLHELDQRANLLTLPLWEPELLFEVKARRLKLLRQKAGRHETDKALLQPEMERLLAGLVAVDPARAAILCH